MVGPVGSRVAQRLRQVLPWAVGLGLLAYLLFPYRDPIQRAKLVTAFRRAPGWAAAVAAAGAVVAYVADTVATWLVLAWMAVRLRFREVAVIRGVTYFLAIVNYSLGQAAMIYVLARHGVRALRATGMILGIMGINVVVLLGTSGLSIAFGSPTGPNERVAALVRVLRLAAEVLCAALPLYGLVLALRPRLLTRYELLQPLFALGPLGHLGAILARLPHIASMLGAHFVMMRCFGVAVPVKAAALYLPIVFAVAVLPISAQGLGTSQLLLITFFGRYAPGDAAAQQAQVLAYSLYLVAIWVPTQVVIGLLSLRTELGRTLRRRARGLTEPERPDTVVEGGS